MSLTEKDKSLILHPFSRYKESDYNIPIAKGSGEILFDEEGKEYVDAISSWWLNLHGHAHPYINRKIHDQLEKLEHVIFSGFTHQPAVSLAEKLITLGGPHYNQVFFSDNGSTSTEVAIKMAIQFWANKNTPKKKILAFKNAYHGDTFGAMSVSERDVFTKHFDSHLFETYYTDIPNSSNLDQLMPQLEKLLSKGDIAAFIFEPLVQGAGGMQMYEPGHLDFLIRLCKDFDVLTIADEVMTGFGRTGKMFAIDHLQQKPDFVCLSKGLTGGYLPLGATMYSKEIADIFKYNEADKTFYHGHSFTGNPISCSAALASLELFEKEQTFDKIKTIESQHSQFLEKVKKYELTTNHRICGTIAAFDIQTSHNDYFYNDPIKDLLYNYYLEQGVLLRPLGNVVYVLPPYCSSPESLNKVYTAILNSLEFISSKTSGHVA